MRLLRMILRGFKSFADKTEVEFAPGVTAIVGPNGSGKSNLADAVRWVLGEQNIRQLRGEQSSDVIFAGTATERAKASAEVTLVFDNSDGFFQTDTAEVAVTRRLLRSGASDYFINRQNCRLKDIQLLLADTGLGRDSLAVIGQQRVDRILIGRPEERKLVFEEVAGITRYKLRKEEGMRKLREAERNMERVSDIARLLAQDLPPLEEKARQAKQRNELRTQEANIARSLAWKAWQTAQRQLTRAEKEWITADQAATAATTELTQLEAAAQAQTEADTKAQQMLREKEQAANIAAQHCERLRSELAVLTERGHQHAKEMQEVAQAVAEKRQTLEQLTAAQATTVAAIAATAQERDEAQARLAEETARRDRLRAMLQAARKQVTDRLRREERSAAEQEFLQQTAQQLQERNVELTRRARELDIRKETLQTRLQQAQAALATAQATASESSRQLTAQEEVVNKLQAQREAAQAANAKARETLQTTQTRYQYLQQLADSYEGYGRATKAVLGATEAWRSDCYGTVAQLLRVPKEYTTALDIALGGTQQHLVMRDSQAAQAAIRFLRRTKSGRVTLYPLDEIRPRTLADRDWAILHEPGVIGLAAALVKAESYLQPLVDYLLGRTVLVEDLATGSRLAAKYQQRIRLVTRAGDLFQPGGALTGGSTRRAELTLFGRQQELAALRAQLETLAAQPERELPDISAALARRDALQNAAQTTALAIASQTAQLQALRDEWNGIVRQADEIRSAQTQTADEYRLTVNKQKELTVAPTAVTETTTDTAAQEAELARCEHAYTEAHVALATVQATLRQQEQEKVRQAEQEKNAQAEMERLTQREKEIQAAAKALSASQETLQKQADEAQQTAQTAKAQAEAFYDAHAERLNAQQAGQERLRAMRAQATETKVEAARLLAKKETAQAEMEQQREQLAMYDLDPQTVEPAIVAGTQATLLAEQRRLLTEIARFTDISEQAIEEYEKSRERSDFYTAQLADLTAARDTLQNVVAEIDRTMQEQFAAAFEVVAAEFQRIFAHLFGGGEAQLILTAADENKPAGVEIMVRPPGKKQQALSLLSGGERALTVIALLFSFMAYRPAPFCLVDEIDAALDDANIKRFTRYLETGRNGLQFIVITHRKPTMAAADRLQGVTMVKRGISQLIAVNLKQYKETP